MEWNKAAILHIVTELVDQEWNTAQNKTIAKEAEEELKVGVCNLRSA